MRRSYIFRRLVAVFPVAFGVLIVVFVLLRLMPGDITSALLGQEATAADVARIREQYGLDQSIIVQFFAYMKSLITFDFGNSIVFKRPVLELLGEALPATLELTVFSLLLALLISIPLGILSAVKQNSWLDNFSMFIAQLGISMPIFWSGLLMILAQKPQQ